MQTMLFLYLKIHRDANAVVAGRKSWSNVPILSAGWVALVALGRSGSLACGAKSNSRPNMDPRATYVPVCLFIFLSLYSHPDIDTFLMH